MNFALSNEREASVNERSPLFLMIGPSLSLSYTWYHREKKKSSVSDAETKTKRPSPRGPRKTLSREGPIELINTTALSKNNNTSLVSELVLSNVQMWTMKRISEKKIFVERGAAEVAKKKGQRDNQWRASVAVVSER